jgi:hypothetical protein
MVAVAFLSIPMTAHVLVYDVDGGGAPRQVLDVSGAGFGPNRPMLGDVAFSDDGAWILAQCSPQHVGLWDAHKHDPTTPQSPVHKLHMDTTDLHVVERLVPSDTHVVALLSPVSPDKPFKVMAWELAFPVMPCQDGRGAFAQGVDATWDNILSHLFVKGAGSQIPTKPGCTSKLKPSHPPPQMMGCPLLPYNIYRRRFCTWMARRAQGHFDVFKASVVMVKAPETVATQMETVAKALRRILQDLARAGQEEDIARIVRAATGTEKPDARTRLVLKYDSRPELWRTFEFHTCFNEIWIPHRLLPPAGSADPTDLFREELKGEMLRTARASLMEAA